MNRLRTRSLFEAERLLSEIAEHAGRGSFQAKARRVMEHFPTKHELMRLCSDHPMLDEEEAQRCVTRADHLRLSESTPACSPSHPM